MFHLTRKCQSNRVSVIGTTINAITALSLSFSAAVAADYYEDCLLIEVKRAQVTAEIGQLRQRCQNKVASAQQGLLSHRLMRERKTQFDPYVITPHRMNYILPITITDNINRQAYDVFGDWADNIEQTEAKFQLSFKVPLITSDLFIEDDALYFGITLQSWWQVYSDNISKPFRETNYQPEIFYMAPLNWHPFGGNTGFGLGIEHQSNGRSQLLSRSWNRVYGLFIFEKHNFVMSIRPWVRLSEDLKQDPLDDDGDDNPDISDFMGHFELSMGYAWNDFELSFKGRENFSTHKGFAELGFTFPLSGRLRGYIQYNTGYGESLIDYNHNQQRLGVGIALTNAL